MIYVIAGFAFIGFIIALAAAALVWLGAIFVIGFREAVRLVEKSRDGEL